ncbi:MAG TPA: hemerythrin domain-containing protein [Anaeromyxobacteraceae bacterium]|nr:hemerythrin domain-containing protein [Anaeromyxobacteraceae bacterium]
MAGPVSRFLEDDHRRLDRLLAAALTQPGAVDLEAFAPFRAGLLRHIALEEKVLLPVLRDRLGGPPPMARRLRVEHGALASLLVPTPTRALVSEIVSILEPHNAMEEDEGGLYTLADSLPASVAEEVVAKLRAYPEVKVAKYYDGPRACRTAAEALALSAQQKEGAGPR